jgi:hypothetical protein
MKYGPRKTKQEAFDKRKDKWAFQKLAKIFNTVNQYEEYIAWFFLHQRKKVFVAYELIDQSTLAKYTKYRAYAESLVYRYKEELLTIDKDCDIVLNWINGKVSDHMLLCQIGLCVDEDNLNSVGMMEGVCLDLGKRISRFKNFWVRNLPQKKTA